MVKKMKYKNIVEGRFIERPNRFIAKVNIDGEVETVHVKNTGRCKELLKENARVYLSVSDNPLRKTKYDLIAVWKGDMLVNMDSQIPNDVAWEYLKSGALFSKNAIIKREVKYGDSRFDFYIEDGDKKAFLEVKGVTLEQDGIARFPDAPTERGTKHIKELIKCKEHQFEAYILFVIQMKGVKYLEPNFATDPIFSETLKKSKESGVKILAVDCIVTPDSITFDKEISVKI